ncbi:hypothetical protein Q7C36_011255 [Tachysurus vachellii]|uniref:Uncharacterized protein n=1 Tax=Tachysurus vachellii TaxID=175792 RepID=A0AA88MTN6_TACVA|nr:hypothetical protein Q7C36_011255 [Tachysurus vachellii]
MLWEEEEVEEVVSSVQSDIASLSPSSSLCRSITPLSIDLGFFRMADSSEPLAPGLVEPDGTLRFLQPSPGTESADPFQMCP